MAEPIPTPSSIPEVEALIQRLYQPGIPPDLVSRIQAKLVELQRSDDGWQLADTLLGSADTTVRYFGCLTFTVKLNADWESLDQQTSIDVLSKLITWFTRMVAADERPMVLQKMCSTFVTYFLKPTCTWTDAVRHLIVCLVRGGYVSEDSLDEHGSIHDLLPQLTANQLISVLWFTRHLSEEGRKVETRSLKQSRIIGRMNVNMLNAVDVMHYAFSNATNPPLPSQGSARDISPQDLSILQAAFHSWIQWDYFANNAWDNHSENVKKLQALTDYALQCCFITESPFGDEAVGAMIDLMIIYGTFFEAPQLASISHMICGPWGQERSDPEGLNFREFGRFLLAFGDAGLQGLVQGNDSTTEEIMRLMHEILKTPGYAVEDDEVIIFAVEFWVSYAEYAMDETQIAGTNGNQNTPEALRVRKHMLEAMMEFWYKIRYPPPETMESWSYDDKSAFKSFRTDVKDLFLTCYETIGEELIENIARLLEESLSHRAWWHLEAAMFALAGFSETLDEDDAANHTIARIFGSSLFADLDAAGDDVPIIVQRSAIDFLGSFASFFEMHLHLLPAALNFLFATLKSPSLINAAARAIVSLCSACRTELTSELESFFTKYEEVLTWASVDTQTKERLIGAISAIAQTLEDDTTKLKAVDRLLDIIERDARSCLDQMRQGQQADVARDDGMSALACLSSMAISFQAPDEAVIDLEADINTPNFWNSGPGREAQNRIIFCVEQILSFLSHDGEIYDRAFEVLKAGFAETVPGPFVLGAGVAINVFRQSSIENPRLDVALTAMAALLKARGNTLGESDAKSLLEHVHLLIEDLEEPSEDPEISQTMVDVLEKYVKNYLTLLVSQGSAVVGRVFEFTLAALKGDNLLPRRSAAAFWSTFIPLSREAPSCDQIQQYYGPALCQILINYIGGEANRSELSTICDPLKALLKNEPRSRGWLESALQSDTFPSTRVDEAQKREIPPRTSGNEGRWQNNSGGNRLLDRVQGNCAVVQLVIGRSQLTLWQMGSSGKKGRQEATQDVMAPVLLGTHCLRVGRSSAPGV